MKTSKKTSIKVNVAGQTEVFKIPYFNIYEVHVVNTDGTIHIAGRYLNEKSAQEEAEMFKTLNEEHYKGAFVSREIVFDN